jgi:Lrp/AsnC family transcriptional regulator
MDAVVGFFQTTGEYDYLLKVLVNDVKAFDEFYKSLISSVVGVRKIMTSFSMEKIKDTTKLPIF